MKGLATYKRSIIIISVLIVTIAILTIILNRQRQEATVIKDLQGNKFVGSLTCAKCHKDIYDTHIHTAHYLTSRRAAVQYIKGSFATGSNEFVFSDSIKVVMEKKGASFFQSEYINGNKRRSRRFDIVTGSGKKGQTYLYWSINRLFQLPITYFTAESQWSNSPGYPDRPIFNRPITSRCLECHTTFVAKTSRDEIEPEEFDRNKIVYGVDCEKCHGPAAKHVEYQSQHPNNKIAKFIINPSSFNRQQSLDLCGLCHGGRLSKTSPSFGFKAGNKLAEYFLIDTAAKNANDIDVHGNQYGLLAASKCFKKSEMTCTTCHNTHENESGQTALFSKRCMSCHNTEHGNFCKMSTSIGNAITKNCIDCHMPEQRSKAIAVLLQGSKAPTSAVMRSHFIKVYPEEARKVLAFIKKTNQQ